MLAKQQCRDRAQRRQGLTLLDERFEDPRDDECHQEQSRCNRDGEDERRIDQSVCDTTAELFGAAAEFGETF